MAYEAGLDAGRGICRDALLPMLPLRDAPLPLYQRVLHGSFLQMPKATRAKRVAFFTTDKMVSDTEVPQGAFCSGENLI